MGVLLKICKPEYCI